MVRKDAQCAECGKELFGGSFLRMENGRPLCLGSADLGLLEYLPRGDAAVTRRATKHSVLRAVVVRWSKTRKRYERQGILAQTDAIRRAEEESLGHAELRERRRERESPRREAEYKCYMAAVAEELKELFPGCPPGEAEAIADHACAKYSGRVGWSAAAKEFDQKALRLAVIAHIRHEHTAYDRLLRVTGDRAVARAEVSERIDLVLAKREQVEGKGGAPGKGGLKQCWTLQDGLRILGPMYWTA